MPWLRIYHRLRCSACPVLTTATKLVSGKGQMLTRTESTVLSRSPQNLSQVITTATRKLQLAKSGANPSTGLMWNGLNRADFFYYRAMLCIRGTSHGRVSVCLSVRPSQVGVLRRLNESSWFLACQLPSTRPSLC